MGDHIVRRGPPGTSARRSAPRPTAELSEQELHGLIRAHEQEPQALEPELELAADAPRTPSASSPRMLAHTLRRAPSPDVSPSARGSTSFRSTEPRASLDRSDVSTIAMPCIERTAEPEPESESEPEPDQFRYSPSDEDPTRLMHHRVAPGLAFDDSIPPAENDFEADCAGMGPFAVAPVHEPFGRAIAEDVPRIDRELAHAVPRARTSSVIPARAPASPAIRVLTITLAFLVAVGAGYLLMQSAS